MTISMVAAAGENNSLGKEGKLLWNLPHDMMRFKNLTIGHPVIMGRKTFETLPRPLKGRTNIILTRNKTYQAEGCIVVNTIEEAISAAKSAEGSDEICIVGGGEIYKLAMPFANKIEFTLVHHKFEEADAYFPELDYSKWELLADRFHSSDNYHQYAFTYLTYIKK